MNVKRNHRHPAISRLGRRPAWTTAFLLSVMSSAPVFAALTIPNTPLESGAQFPPPNVVFILDDSGSMEYYAMPRNISSRSSLDDDLTDKYYQENTIYYDPSKVYRAWIKADGTRFTDGTSLSSVWNHPSLRDSSTNISNNTQTWFYEKPGIETPDDFSDVYRYQIRRVNGTLRVVRSEWLPAGSGQTTTLVFDDLDDTDGSRNYRNYQQWTVPSGTTQLIVTLSGGTHGTNGGVNNNSGRGADLYIDNDTSPNSGAFCTSTGNGNNESCTVNNPSTGTWSAIIYSHSNYRNVTMTVTMISTDPITGEENAGCSTSASGTNWRDCQFRTPTGRSEADEMTNYATWYSYHSTRMKVAKSGAGDAFAQIGRNFRVGFDSIWNRNLSNSSISTSGSAIAFGIPVATNDGLFESTNKTNWYSYLYASNGSSGTPLQGALQRTGRYYQSNASSGPWGPGAAADQLSCRQSFAILTTDGFWNNTSGYTALGDVDGVSGPTITGPNGQSYQYTRERPYCDNNQAGGSSAACTTSSSDNAEDTVADVAMYFWNRDLRTDLANNVAVSEADPAFWQHMVTFGVSIGLPGTLDPETDLPSLINGSKGWPDPTDSENADRIDDLFHAAVNGRGSFVLANDSDEFQRALLEAFAVVSQRQGSASNVTANSTSFQTNTLLFQARYTTGKWSGDILAFDATSAGVAQTPSWVASDEVPAWNARDIFTWNGSDGAEFPTTAQLALLDQSLRANGPVNAANNAEYIKGRQTLEAQNDNGTGAPEELRNRDSALADIVNSSPFYVAESDTLYVGSNSGMLHAFNATTGAEVFAYVPGSINFSRLATLSDPFYTHEYFVDGPVAVSNRRQTPGKNYLIGSLGRGGKALYGLDVTSPASFGVDDVLWELTDPDLGFVLGEPLIATLNDASSSKVAIVGNGIKSTNGSAVLFVIRLSDGTVLFEIDTGADASENGLFAPRGADVDGDGTVDFVYAGDQLGNLWKFDFTGTTPEVALEGSPFFTTPNGQPITAGLALSRDPETRLVWVHAATGSFIYTEDVLPPKKTEVQSVYGLIDQSLTDESYTEVTLTVDDLVERDIAIVTTSNGRVVRGFEQIEELPDDVFGWYIDLDDPTAGERVITRPQVFGTTLFFVSRVPPQDNTCDAGGSGFINAVHAFTGTGSENPFFDINNDGAFDDGDTVTGPNGETIVIGSYSEPFMPTAATLVGDRLFYGGSGGEIGSVPTSGSDPLRRRATWVELINN